jgi:serine/threonine-protein kinase
VPSTAAYLAPEQARGEEAGPRADLYSLGVVIYQLLSGRLPYEATSLSELALKQQREAPAPLDDVNPHVPHELAQAVAMALAIDQEARPANALLLAEAFRNGLHGVPPLGAGSPTASLGTGAATRILPERDEPTAATRIVRERDEQLTPPRVARVPPSRREPPRRAVQATPPPARSGEQAFRRLMALVLLILVFAGAVAIAVVVATSTSNTVVHTRSVIAKDFNDAVSQVQNLISGNTK